MGVSCSQWDFHFKSSNRSTSLYTPLLGRPRTARPTRAAAVRNEKRGGLTGNLLMNGDARERTMYGWSVVNGGDGWSAKDGVFKTSFEPNTPGARSYRY